MASVNQVFTVIYAAVLVLTILLRIAYMGSVKDRLWTTVLLMAASALIGQVLGGVFTGWAWLISLACPGIVGYLRIRSHTDYSAA